jgi:CelD/BcsL family acetyltransferase involved in cellulose biosynthesis
MRGAATATRRSSFRLPTGTSRAAAPARHAELLDLSLHHDLSRLRDEWLAFEEIADCTVFQTYEWLAAYQRFIGTLRGEKPCIAIVRADDGTPVCLLPLAVRQAGFVRELTWLGDELSDYNAPLLATNFGVTFGESGFTRLWRDLLARLQSDRRTSFDVVRLTKMPERVGGQVNPFVSGLTTRLNASGSYMTPLRESWDGFYAAKRSAATRRRDRTKRARLAECGRVSFEVPTDAKDIVPILDTLMQQKSKFFAERGIGNIFARSGYAAFYRAVATDPSFSRIAHVSKLEVGGEAAATNLGLIFRGRYYYVLASYTDGPAARFSVGTFHLHELMSYAINRGLAWFDFTIGDESYKRDWCDGVYQLYDHIGIATTRGSLVALPLKLTQSMKRAIKQTPILWAIFSKARATLRRDQETK